MAKPPRTGAATHRHPIVDGSDDDQRRKRRVEEKEDWRVRRAWERGKGNRRRPRRVGRWPRLPHSSSPSPSPAPPGPPVSAVTHTEISEISSGPVCWGGPDFRYSSERRPTGGWPRGGVRRM